MNGNLESAAYWLNTLRAGATNYDGLIGLIRKELEGTSLSFKCIGTSEEEIEELRVLGCKTAAANWLGYLRNGTTQYVAFIAYVHEEARKGGLSLKEVGTSEEEIEELRVRGCKVAAKF